MTTQQIYQPLRSARQESCLRLSLLTPLLYLTQTELPVGTGVISRFNIHT